MDQTPAPPPRPTRAIPRHATSVAAYSAGSEPEAQDALLAFPPFLHPQPRRNSITPDLQRRFVAALAATGIVNQAARSIGKSMEALYKLRARPGAEGFAAAWDEALTWGMERLEDCALERALIETEFGGSANSMLCFVLHQRSRFRIDVRDIVSGHPVYESIKAKVLAKTEETAAACAPVEAS